MSFFIPDHVYELMRVLNENGFECFIVGEAVRNYLLQIPVHDYELFRDFVNDDVEVENAPEQLARLKADSISNTPDIQPQQVRVRKDRNNRSAQL